MHGGGDEGSLDFDINLAPIIDCLTVLIAFLLISTSYVSLYMIEASVATYELAPAAASPAKPDEKPTVNVALQISQDGRYELSLTGGASEHVNFPRSGTPAQQIEELKNQLQAIQAKWSNAQSITVSGEGEVPYHEIIRVMEAARGTFKTVLLGGF